MENNLNFYYLFCIFVVSLLSIILHELGHAVVALWQGDETARLAGRITLNPFKHIDPMMSIFVPLLLALIGMPILGGAKPVPINTHNLKHGEYSFALVAIAGPLVNFILAFIFYALLVKIETSSEYFISFVSAGLFVNLGFMLFNLIPIPPLDGSRVLYALAPDFVRDFMQKIERHGFFIIYFLILIGGATLSKYIVAGEEAVLSLFDLVL